MLPDRDVEAVRQMRRSFNDQKEAFEKAGEREPGRERAARLSVNQAVTAVNALLGHANQTKDDAYRDQARKLSEDVVAAIEKGQYGKIRALSKRAKLMLEREKRRATATAGR